MIAMRKKHPAFGRGSIEFYWTENPKVLVFLRRYGNESLLVIINLSDSAQVVSVDLSAYSGYVPIELFSGNKFPGIKDDPAVFTLDKHSYFWFSLHQEDELALGYDAEDLPVLESVTAWEGVFREPNRSRLEMQILPAYIRKQRWFRAKGRSFSCLRIQDAVHLSSECGHHYLLIVQIHYTQGNPERYLLPVSFCQEADLPRQEETAGQGIIGYLKFLGDHGALLDSLFDPDFQALLLQIIAREKQWFEGQGALYGLAGDALRTQTEADLESLEPSVFTAEQSNSSIKYDSTYLFKMYRKLEQGINPDSEMVLYLTEKQQFPYTAPFAGQILYRNADQETMTLGLLQQYVPNQGDSWDFVLKNLQHYFEYILAKKTEITETPSPSASLFANRYAAVEGLLLESIGGYFLEMIHLLGQISAEMHLALSRETEDKAFVPEAFSKLYQRSMYQSMRSLTKKTMSSLQRNKQQLPLSLREEAGALLGEEASILQQLSAITHKKIDGIKIRIHGDYHLGQVLYTGNSFVLIDFEGEPTRPLSERRLKRSYLKDAAGMIRSFHYAAYCALYQNASVRNGDVEYLQNWLEPWYRTTAGIFLESYLEKIQGTRLIPKDREEQEMLLDIYLLEKAVYELGYELDNRPEWTTIPIRGIQQILQQ